jgi:hypothetical protein
LSVLYSQVDPFQPSLLRSCLMFHLHCSSSPLRTNPRLVCISMTERNPPLVFKILRILFPVTNLTWGIPCESRRMTPIWEGESPRLANLKIWSETSSGVALDQDGCERRNGRADEEIPFPLECILSSQSTVLLSSSCHVHLLLLLLMVLTTYRPMLAMCC